MKKFIILIFVILVCILLFLSYKSKSVVTVYQGVLPCANCSGIDTTLSIKGEDYEMSTKYLGSGGTTDVERGKIKKISEDVIKVGDFYYKIISKNELLRLDMNGNVINSKLNYKLLKK